MAYLSKDECLLAEAVISDLIKDNYEKQRKLQLEKMDLGFTQADIRNYRIETFDKGGNTYSDSMRTETEIVSMLQEVYPDLYNLESIPENYTEKNRSRSGKRVEKTQAKIKSRKKEVSAICSGLRFRAGEMDKSYPKKSGIHYPKKTGEHMKQYKKALSSSNEKLKAWASNGYEASDGDENLCCKPFKKHAKVSKTSNRTVYSSYDVTRLPEWLKKQAISNMCCNETVRIKYDKLCCKNGDEADSFIRNQLTKEIKKLDKKMANKCSREIECLAYLVPGYFTNPNADFAEAA